LITVALGLYPAPFLDRVGPAMRALSASMEFPWLH